MNRQQQRAAVRAALAAAPKERGTVAAEREGFEAMVAARPPQEGVSFSATELGVRVEGAPGRKVLLYLHGGGFVVGSARTGARLAAALTARIGGTGHSLEYRLAPEHPFPAALADALAAYRTLLADTDPADLVVAGDSAGGGLAVLLLIAARDAGLPQPAAAAVFSPWVDQTLSGDSMRTRDGIDPLFTIDSLRWYADKFAGGVDASPIFTDLSGLSPLLIQVGGDEVLLDDALRLAGKAAADGLDVTLEVTAGLPHVYQTHYGLLDDADEALDRAGAFLSRY